MAPTAYPTLPFVGTQRHYDLDVCTHHPSRRDFMSETFAVSSSEDTEGDDLEQQQNGDDSIDPKKMIVPCKESQWDYFMCHKQSNGQDATLLLQMFLGEQLPGVRCWVDIEQDPTKRGMHEGVKYCRNFLLYLTEEATRSMWVRQEIEWALAYKKNIVLVMETDDRHGKPDLDLLKAALPEEYRIVFNTHVAIPFFRDPEFRQVSLNKIIRSSDLARTRTVTSDDGDKSPLVFRARRWTDDDEVLFDSWFVLFTTFCGIALPGASRDVKRWSVAVRAILLICGVACASRAWATDGPAYMDYETILQIVVAHPVIFWYLHVTLGMLDSDMMRDMLANHIDARNDAMRIRFNVRIATGVSIVTTTALTIVAWLAYLPGFFNSHYIGSHSTFSAKLFGIGHGLIWVFILPLFFGSLFCCLLMIYIIQELAYMNIVTAFNQLDTRCREVGLHAMLEANETLSISWQSLYRFQEALNAAYQRYLKLQRGTYPAFGAFWLVQVLILPWALSSLWEGFFPKTSAEAIAVEKIRHNWFLMVRLGFFTLAGLFFGLPQWVIALQPWTSQYYSARMNCIRDRIIVTQTDMLPTLIFFLERCDMRFKVGFLRTDWVLLPFYVAVLFANTAGWQAYAARLYLSL